VLDELTAKGGLAVYVNCVEYPTLHSVLEKLIGDLHILRTERISTSYKLEQLARFLKGRPLVIALDEIDRVAPKDQRRLLYTFASLQKTGVVCIASSETFLQGLEDAVRSRLLPVEIRFEPYNPETLESILEQRAELGLRAGACDPALIAGLANFTAGDARAAIQALRRGAMAATQQGKRVIALEHVKEGWQDGAQLRREYLASLLSDHHRAILDILAAHGQLTSTRLYRSYLGECERLRLRPIAVRTFSHYMCKLAAMGLVESRRADAKGNTKLFRFPEPPSRVR
jgi:Cdc6-like AAA superfamily ATPase